MQVRTRLAAGGTALALALSGVTVATVGATWAAAADQATSTEDGTATQEGAAGDGTTEEATSLVDRIQQALSGLVDDGTLTQEQAGTVADTLASSDALRGGPHGPGPGPGGHGHGPGFGPGPAGLDTAAQTLGLSEEELRSALADGASLAQVAEEQGVAVDDLVDALVSAAQEHLAEEVADGRLTQDQADELASTLPDRLAERVQQAWEPRGPGRSGAREDEGPASEGSGGDDASSTSDA